MAALLRHRQSWWLLYTSLLSLLATSTLCLSDDPPPLGFDVTPFHPSLPSNVSSATWQLLRPALFSPTPVHRYGHSSLSTSSILVITHGYYFDHAAHSAVWLSDTWTFSYSSHLWTRIHPPCPPSSSPSPPDCPSGRFGATATAHDGHLLLYGGDDGGHPLGVASYSPSLLSDIWRLPLSPPHHWSRLSTSVSTAAILVAGFPASAALAQHGIPHAQHTAAALQGQAGAALLVFAGMTPRQDGDAEDTAGGEGVAASDQLWLLPLIAIDASVEWQRLPCNAGPDGRFGHAMTAAVPTLTPTGAPQSALYVYGGFRRGRGNYGDLWRLLLSDPPSQGCEWTRLSAVEPSASAAAPVLGPYPRGYASLVAGEGYVLLFGGAYCAPGCVCSQETWAWDLQLQRWATPALLTAEAPQGRYKHSGVMRGVDEQGMVEVVVFGGESYHPQKYHADVWLLRYDHWQLGHLLQWRLSFDWLSPASLGALTLLVTCLLLLLVAHHRRRSRRATKTT